MDVCYLLLHPGLNMSHICPAYTCRVCSFIQQTSQFQIDSLVAAVPGNLATFILLSNAPKDQGCEQFGYIKDKPECDSFKEKDENDTE